MSSQSVESAWSELSPSGGPQTTVFGPFLPLAELSQLLTFFSFFALIFIVKRCVFIVAF
jgi:hypothetical protein